MSRVIFDEEGGVVVNAAQRLLQIVRSDVGERVEFLIAANQVGVSAAQFRGDRRAVAPRLSCGR